MTCLSSFLSTFFVVYTYHYYYYLVARCVNSAFEILLPPLVTDDNDNDYVRGWRLDPAAQQAVIALAKQVGDCGDCHGTGNLQQGLHVSFQAEIIRPGDSDGTPPTVALRGGNDSLMLSTPETLQCLGGSARPAPFVDKEEEEPTEQGVIRLASDLRLQITDNGDDTATFTLEYEGEAWISLAVSPTGTMVGSQAVIGLPNNNNNNPMLYDLNARDRSGVVPAETQILLSSNITQEDGVTTMTFTVPMETQGFFVPSSGPATFLYAYGFDNTLDTHQSRNSFVADVAGGGVSLAQDPTKYYKFHGWCMALAWGLLCPLAIGASLLRRLFPPGVFFQLHRALNSTVILLNVVAFGLAIRATNIEKLDHFRQENHRKLGLVIVVLAILQAAGGFARPHLPSPPEPMQQSDHEENKAIVSSAPSPQPPAEEKSWMRKTWEVGHRIVGFTLLVLAWINCTTGLDRFFLKFPNEGDVDQWTSAFWGIVGGLAGSIAVGYGVVTFLKYREKNTP